MGDFTFFVGLVRHIDELRAQRLNLFFHCRTHIRGLNHRAQALGRGNGLQACYAREGKASRAEEGAADARFHLAIAEASHNLVLLHTIRGLFDLLKRNVVTNIGGMYALRSETRRMLVAQHQALFDAIMQGRADDARRIASEHISYVQDVLEEREEESRRLARAQRRERPISR